VLGITSEDPMTQSLPNPWEGKNIVTKTTCGYLLIVGPKNPIFGLKLPSVCMHSRPIALKVNLELHSSTLCKLKSTIALFHRIELVSFL